jgi:DnaK suppressor protein
MMKDQIKILQNELVKVQNQIDRLETAVQIEPDYGRGEADPSITSRQVDRALLEHLNERVETLKSAISGVDEGMYGVCQRCGDAIHPGRLAVLPDTELCVDCAQRDQRE